MSAGDDDFDRLGAAVARVLRDAFQTAEEMRRGGIADAGDLAVRVGGEIERSLKDALALQSQVRREADDVLATARSAPMSRNTASAKAGCGCQSAARWTVAAGQCASSTAVPSRCGFSMRVRQKPVPTLIPARPEQR